MSHLVPEVRVNRNGVAVTNHVRPDTGGADASARRIPAAPRAPPAQQVPPTLTFEESLARFEDVKAKNLAWADREDPVVIDRRDRGVLASLLRMMSERDDYDDARLFSAIWMVENGDVLGAESVLDNVADSSEPSSCFAAMDIWEEGVRAGVLERNRLYPREAEDRVPLYPFMVSFYAEAAEEFPVREASADDYRALALIHERLPEADPVHMSEFFQERGEIDAQAYLAAMDAAPALGRGAL